MNIKSAFAVFVLTFALPAVASNHRTGAQNNSNDSDRIYSGGEVDKKAVVDKRVWDLNYPSPVGCKDAGLVVIRAVLRKTGKATNVAVVQKGNCLRFEQKATKAVEKVRFKPAQKDGAPVSTYMQFDFNYNCTNAPGGECP